MKTKTAVRGGLQVATARAVRGGITGGRCGLVADPVVTVIGPAPVILTANVLAV
jgi:hypothetical protein